MNYLAEIVKFYEIVQVHNLSSGQIALWHGLMHICNKTGWKPVFTAPNITLELVTGLSRSAIQKNREVLKELGLIDYIPNGTKATLYRIKSMQDNSKDSALDESQENEDMSKSNQDGTQESTQDSGKETEDIAKSNQVSVQDSTQESNQEQGTMSKSVQVSVQNSGTFFKQNKTISLPRGSKKTPPLQNTFVPPTVEEVEAYCSERGYKINPRVFVSHYTGTNWRIGNTAITDWKAIVDNWECKEEERRQSWTGPKRVPSSSGKVNKFHNFEQRETDYNQILADYYGYQDVAE